MPRAIQSFTYIPRPSSSIRIRLEFVMLRMIYSASRISFWKAEVFISTQLSFVNRDNIWNNAVRTHLTPPCIRFMSEYLVTQSKGCIRCGNVRTDLRNDGKECYLLQICSLAAHIWPGDNLKAARKRCECVVWNNRLFGNSFHYRMPAIFYRENWSKFWSN